MAKQAASKMTSTNLSERDMQLVTIVLKYCAGGAEGLKIDLKALAKHGGFSSTNSASASWCSVKKKLFAKDNVTNGASGDENSSNQGSPSNNGIGAEIGDLPDDEGPVAATPAKKPRAPRKPKAAAAQTGEGGEGTPTQKRVRKVKEPNATPNKRAKKSAAVADDTEADTEILADAENPVKHEFEDGEAEMEDGENVKAKLEEEASAEAV